jgi:uncharacterized phage-associated protein
VRNRYPLFNANFVAFEQGPVEYDIYQIEKQNQASLLNDASLELKLQLLPNRKQVLELIEQDVNRYQDYFNNVWTHNHGHDANYNPTHPQRNALAKSHRKRKKLRNFRFGYCKISQFRNYQVS